MDSSFERRRAERASRREARRTSLLLLPSSRAGASAVVVRAVEARVTTFVVHVYGLSARGCVRADQSVWYEADVLCALLGLPPPAVLCSAWPTAHVAVTEGGHLVSRVGLLRLLAHSNSDAAARILEDIAQGLDQLRGAERVVRGAATARLAALEALSHQKRAQEEEEFAQWRRDKEAKTAQRKAARDTPQMPHRAVREQAREQLAHASSEGERRRGFARARKASLVQLYAVADVALSDAPLLRPEPSEAKVEPAISYLERDDTRPLKSVPAPTVTVLSEEQVFSGANGTPAMTVLVEHFRREGRIDRVAAMRLLRQGAALFRTEPNCLEIQAPVHVFGDIHGQVPLMCTSSRR